MTPVWLVGDITHTDDTDGTANALSSVQRMRWACRATRQTSLNCGAHPPAKEGTARRRACGDRAHLADEVLGALGDAGLGRKLEVHLEDALVGLAVPLGLKGGRPTQELVAQHAQAPHIHIGIVVVPLNHLWREVVQRSTQRLPAHRHSCLMLALCDR